MRKVWSTVVSIVALVVVVGLIAVGCATTQAAQEPLPPQPQYATASEVSELRGEVKGMGTTLQIAVQGSQQTRIAVERTNVQLDNIKRQQEQNINEIKALKEFQQTAEPVLKSADWTHKRVHQMVDRPGAPTGAPVAAKGRMIAVQGGNLTITNPSSAQLKKALEEKRDPLAVRLYGPTDEARNKVWAGFLKVADEAKFDLAAASITKQSIVAHTNGAAYAAVEVEFGPIPAAITAARTAPALPAAPATTTPTPPTR